MNSKLFVAFALLGLASQSLAACLCGFGAGKDMCTDKSSIPSACSPLVVRPAPLPKIDFITGSSCSKPRVVCKEVASPSGLKPLTALGDLCSCRQAIVSPALVPRPACARCQNQNSCSSSSSNSNNQQQQQQQTIYDAVPTVYQSPVEAAPQPSFTSYGRADPVSLSLAYQQARKSCGISEDRLAFGFRSVPKEQPIVKIIRNVNEGNLHRLNGQIVEFKPVPCAKVVRTVDEEAMEDLLAEEFAAEEAYEASQGQGVKTLTYGELGYGPARVQATPFIAVQGSAIAQEENNQNSYDTYDDGSSTCNDGFVPGNVIIKSIPQQQVYVPSPTVEIPCAQEEELVYPVRYPVFQNSYTSSSSNQQQSSSSNSQHQRVIFENFAPCDQ